MRVTGRGWPFAIGTFLSVPASFSCADIMYQVNHLIRVLAVAALAVAMVILVLFQVV